MNRVASYLVVRLLEKEQGTQMNVREACKHTLVLVTDGDTYCHLMHDPVLVKTDSAVERKDNVESNKDSISRYTHTHNEASSKLNDNSEHN